MVEMENDNHQKRLQEVQRAEVSVLGSMWDFADISTKKLMQAFCSALPRDRLLLGDELDINKVLETDAGKRTYTIQSTGAKLTYTHATNVLSRYAASLVGQLFSKSISRLMRQSSNMRKKFLLVQLSLQLQREDISPVK